MLYIVMKHHDQHGKLTDHHDAEHFLALYGLEGHDICCSEIRVIDDGYPSEILEEFVYQRV